MHGVALGIGCTILIVAFFMSRRSRQAVPAPVHPQNFFPAEHAPVQRPVCWMAIRSVSLEAVQQALGLNRAEPCSWVSGLSGDHGFFISPRVHGWVIVTGNALPTPTEDVDATYVFLSALSRKLGHVQYFYASRLLHHHAWARLDDGYVSRAYAWTGETVWNQGPLTLPEHEACLKLSGYGEHTVSILDAGGNFEKVPQLAARWSLDPAEVKLDSLRQYTGIAGESALI